MNWPINENYIADASDLGSLRVYSRKNLEVVWENKNEYFYAVQILSNGDIVGFYGTLQCWTPKGRKRWVNHSLPKESQYTPRIQESRRYVFMNVGDILFGIHKKTGKTAFTQEYLRLKDFIALSEDDYVVDHDAGISYVQNKETVHHYAISRNNLTQSMAELVISPSHQLLLVSGMREYVVLSVPQLQVMYQFHPVFSVRAAILQQFSWDQQKMACLSDHGVLTIYSLATGSSTQKNVMAQEITDSYSNPRSSTVYISNKHGQKWIKISLFDHDKLASLLYGHPHPMPWAQKFLARPR